jgi:hypothetical protein
MHCWQLLAIPISMDCSRYCGSQCWSCKAGLGTARRGAHQPLYTWGWLRHETAPKLSQPVYTSELHAPSRPEQRNKMVWAGQDNARSQCFCTQERTEQGLVSQLSMRECCVAASGTHGQGEVGTSSGVRVHTYLVQRSDHFAWPAPRCRKVHHHETTATECSIPLFSRCQVLHAYLLVNRGNRCVLSPAARVQPPTTPLGVHTPCVANPLRPPVCPSFSGLCGRQTNRST